MCEQMTTQYERSAADDRTALRRQNRQSSVLAMLLEMDHRNGLELVRDQFPTIDCGVRDLRESTWREMLHDGVRNRSGFFRRWVVRRFATSLRSHARLRNGIGTVDLELVFRPDSKLYDGRFANNGWLQEMPDPMTKLTWDNAALMSPATAEKLGVAHEDVVKLKFKGREVEAPVYVMPGQADGTVAVSLGYGRTAAGKVGGSAADGIEPVGFDAYKLRTTDAMWFGTGLTVEPTGKKHRFATTHDRLLDRQGRHARAGRNASASWSAR